MPKFNGSATLLESISDEITYLVRLTGGRWTVIIALKDTGMRWFLVLKFWMVQMEAASLPTFQSKKNHDLSIIHVAATLASPFLISMI